MKNISIIKHAKSAPGLRLYGAGSDLRPCKGLAKLKSLFDNNTFWATNRNLSDLKVMLFNSSIVVSAWHSKQMVGFGRATSDNIFRAVLWDIVIDDNFQGIGLGQSIVNTILESKELKNTEKIYLMTTNSENFYNKISFKSITSQKLLMIDNNTNNQY